MGSFLSTTTNDMGASTPSPTKSMERLLEEKAMEIEECLARKPVNLWHLRELALTRGGLLQGRCLVVVIVVMML
jgi:hypothetical protein